MNKVINLIILSLFFALPALSSGDMLMEKECQKVRRLNSSEKRQINNLLDKIKRTLPRPPKEWRIQRTKPIRNLNKQVCDESPEPVDFSYLIEYVNMSNARRNVQVMEQKDLMKKMGVLMQEMGKAMQANDQQKVKALQRKMKALQSGNMSGMAAELRIRINYVNLKQTRGKKRFNFPGARYAFRWDSDLGERIVLILGKGVRIENGTGTLRHKLDYSLPHTSAQVIEITLQGEIAEELARNINIKALNRLLVK